MPMPYDLSSDLLDVVLQVSLQVSESPGSSPVVRWSITGHGFAAILIWLRRAIGSYNLSIRW